MNARNNGSSRLKASLTTLVVSYFLASTSAQTIPNPSFENNSFNVGVGYISGNAPISGWTAADNSHAGLNPVAGTNFPFADNGAIPDGKNVAFIQSGTNSSLSTLISKLTIGRTYTMKFRVNSRAGYGWNPGPPMPNLKVAIDGGTIISTTITNVGGTSSYRYIAFNFTATAKKQTMTLVNDSSGDQTVLIDDFRIAPRDSGWSYAAWTNDASSGVDGTKTYTHAFNFGSDSNAIINGLTFTNTGRGTGDLSENSFSTAGLFAVDNDSNNLTSGAGGSAVLASDFRYGGTTQSITIDGLLVGNSYEATIYSVGFDTNGSGAATFSVGDDRLTVDQDQFGYHNGIRVSYAYTATAKSITLTYEPLQGANRTFHTYGFCNAQLIDAHAALLVVTNLADSGPGTLRQVISNAAPGEAITFARSLSGKTNVLTSGELFIPYNLTIDASALPGGFTISGSQRSRDFELAANTVITLNSLTVQDGTTNGPGGGILLNVNANLTLTNCTLSGNIGGTGGGIYAVGGPAVTINSSTVSGNSASAGGGVFVISSTLTINGSKFSANSAYGIGGGIYAEAGAATINDSTISGNSAPNGAGVFVDTGEELTINGSTFSDNSAADGGGIYVVNGRITINGSTFSGNSAMDANGGGIRLFGEALTINGSTISSNSAGSSGGGLWLGGGNSQVNDTIVAANSAPTGNNIVVTNGAFFSGVNDLIDVDPLLAPLGNYGGPTDTMRPRPGSPAIDAGLDSITNLLATDQRGYPRRFGAHVDIGAVEAQVTVVSNLNDGGAGSLRAALVAPTELIGFATNLAGGTITLTSGQINVASNVTVDATALASKVTVSGNHASRILEVSGGSVVTLDSLSLINGSIGSGGSGGAALIDRGAMLTLNSLTVSNNFAIDGLGGGIGNFGGVLVINDTTISGNTAAGAGAIENEAGRLTINGSTFSGNVTITGDGGAIDNVSGAILLLNNSTLSGNFAVVRGGGIENFQATAILNNSTLSANSASGAGGFNNKGTLAMTNTIVAGNTAPTFADIDLDATGSFSGANNLTDIDPLLAPLGDYGGATETMPPVYGSPAIDAGLDSVTNFLAIDQRGNPRLSGAHVDIGAVEGQWAPAGYPPVLTGPELGTNGTFSFSFTNAPMVDFTVLTSTNVALPRSRWSILGKAVQSVPGQYGFTDFGATNTPQRFYNVVSP